MLGNHGRSITKTIFTPLAVLLNKCHVTPNMVTVAGTVIAVGLSVGLLANGHLLIGGIALGIVLFMDSVDGILARMTGSSSDFGAFLDSTMDRIADGAVFGSLLWWAVVGVSDSAGRTAAILAGIICMTVIGVVPYVRAKAEVFGIIAKVGLAERTDRLIVILVGAALFNLGLSVWFFAAGFIWVAVASTITIFQRIVVTYNQLNLQQQANSTDR